MKQKLAEVLLKRLSEGVSNEKLALEVAFAPEDQMFIVEER